MTIFEGALINEQGVTFGIVAVKPHVIQNRPQAQDMISVAETNIFPGHPVVLAANSCGRMNYFGRQDIVRFLSNINPARIPWSRYQVS
jgi:hypothetical protein